MTIAAASAAGVTLNTVRANVLTWSTSERFDIVLDSRCLHERAFTDADRPRYKEQVLRWLADDDDYVPIHFDRRHLFDCRPAGPRRRTRRQILAFFSPEPAEKAADFDERRTPLPVGPLVGERAYWFRWKRA